MTHRQRFQTVLDDLTRARGHDPSAKLGGVKVADILESAQQPKRVYDPSSPLAGEDGYVTMPNVDVVFEMVDMISASRGYEANLAVARAAKDMVSSTLQLGR